MFELEVDHGSEHVQRVHVRVRVREFGTKRGGIVGTCVGRRIRQRGTGCCFRKRGSCDPVVVDADHRRIYHGRFEE